MGRTLAAGSAVFFFVIALVLLGLNVDRFSALASLAGLTAMSVAVLLHVADPGHR